VWQDLDGEREKVISSFSFILFGADPPARIKDLYAGGSGKKK
jgi:hypothetical protein